MDGEQLSEAFQLSFGHHVLQLNQEVSGFCVAVGVMQPAQSASFAIQVAFDFQGTKFVVTVESLDHAQFGETHATILFCLFAYADIWV